MAHREGGIGDQVVVGDYVLQIGSIHGGVVQISTAAQQPHLQARSTPAFLHPPQLPGLLDREAEMRAALAALQSAAPVEFHGPAGLGKTALLRHLARQVAQQPALASFPDGVVYLLARRQSVADLLQSIFDAFYASDVPFRPTDSQIRQALRGKRALVLLDDVHLPHGEVRALIDAAPTCTFLLASPERCLWGQGQSIGLHGLSLDAALALVERGLGRSLTTEERPVAQALCTALDGHPLYVLQAVALVREGNCALAEVAGLVQAPASAEALTARALAALSEPQRRILAVLAALDDAPVHADHLSALSGLPDVAPILETLQERGLVQAHSPRYSLAGNLSQVVRQTWDLAPWAERALDYFAAWAEGLRQAPGRLVEEADAILRALERAVEAGRWAGALRLGRAVEGALALGGRWSAWAQMLQWMSQAAQATGDRAARAWALHQLGTRALCLGDTATAREALIQALRLRETLSDRGGAGVTRHNLNLLVGPPPPSRQPVRPPATRLPARPAAPAVPLRLIGTVALFFLFAVLLALGGLGIWSIWPRRTPAPPAPTATPTSTPTPTATPTSTPTPTPVPTSTPTQTPIPTNTPTPTSTPTPTATPTSTPTGTPTPTSTPTLTPTPDRVGPPAPQLLAPERGARLSCPPGSTALWVQLQWAAVYDPSGIQSYEVYLEAIERSPYVYPLQTSTTSYFNVFVPCAEVYRWWVRAIDGVGNVGMGSEARGFSIPDVVAPPAPTLVEPAEGAEIPCSAGGAVTVTLRWNPVTDLTGIVQYEVELVKTPDDAPVPITSTLQITGTQSQTAISGGCGANYRWRVRATDGASNVGEWSAPGTFHILAPPQTSAIFRAFRVVSRYSCSKFGFRAHRT